jgi:plasmid stabilization system protein ParE
MTPVIWTPPALHDVARLYGFLAPKNRDAADIAHIGRAQHRLARRVERHDALTQRSIARRQAHGAVDGVEILL